MYRCVACNAEYRDEDEYRRWHTCPGRHKQSERPPLGIMPRKIWEERRIDDIREAIMRYTSFGSAIPHEWIEEYNELIKRVSE